MSDTPIIASIVEGYGEVEALRPLVRRIALEVFGCFVEVCKPHRVSRHQMTGDTMYRAVQMQSTRVTGPGGVLVLADADDDDPCQLVSKIMQAAQRGDGVRVAIAVREYEAWFLAGIQSLRTHRSVRNDARYDGDPELPRDAKTRLEAQMVEKYRETIHQPAFSSILDIAQARRSPSFDNLVDQVGGLLGI